MMRTRGRAGDMSRRGVVARSLRAATVTSGGNSGQDAAQKHRRIRLCLRRRRRRRCRWREDQTDRRRAEKTKDDRANRYKAQSEIDTIQAIRSSWEVMR